MVEGRTEGPAVPSVGVSLGRRESVYVGRLLKIGPRSGMNREFCTFVSVESVATSGSDAS